MSQEVIEITEREIEVIEVVERGPSGPTGPQANINYTVVSSAQTLSNSQNIAADTSGGSFTLTLPASPNEGDSIDIFDYAETFNTNPLLIARNGERIESIEEDLIANVQGAYFTMIYTGSTRGWQILPRYGTSGGGGESILTNQGDTLYRGALVNERLPIGTAGQILKVNSTSTAPEWGAAPATGVTSVTGTAPIVSSGGATPAISISAATPSAAGSMSSTDKTKLDGIAANANNYAHPNHSGDVTSVGDGATTIANDAVTNAKLANMAASTLKGRISSGTGDPEDLSASDVRTIINVADGATANTASTATPQALGTAAAGTASEFSRGDHTHAMPSASDVGAVSAQQLPLDPAMDGVYNDGVTLVYDEGSLSFNARNINFFFRTDNLLITDPLDSEKAVAFDVSGVTTETTRTLTVPDKNITIADDADIPTTAADIGAVADTDARLSDDRNPTSHASSHLPEGADELFDQSLNTDDDVAFNNIEAFEFKSPSGEAAVGFFDDTIILTGEFAEFNSVIDFSSTELRDASRDNLGLGDSATADIGTTAGTVAAGDDSRFSDIPDPSTATPQALGSASAGTSDDYSRGDHIHAAPALNDLSNVSAATPSDNDVLTFDTATSTWVAGAAAAGGVSAIGTSAADVFSVSGSDLVADDGNTIDGADPFIKWDDTAGKLVYANPLSRPSGAFYVGLAPTTTALGTDAINIQTGRASAGQVALGPDTIAIGRNSTSLNSSISIGRDSTASSFGVAVGQSTNGNERGVALGHAAVAGGERGIAIGESANAGNRRIAIGVGITGAVRCEFATYAFRSCYWGGQTTDATPTVLNLDATATNRFTIAANTALAVDILLVARRSDTADKWLVARRFLGIRRDGSNNTSLIGSVQTLGTDQSDGSPTWSFALTADNTNNALQLEVTGAASETVQWRATAFYRVV
jgi:hypothetical protein